MPFESMVPEILHLCERRATTPVLVTPSYLSFRTAFFVEFVTALESHTNRRIRLDWYRGMPGPLTLFADGLASKRVRKLNRLLKSKSSRGDEFAYMQITAAIGRPGGPNRELVVGLADANAELPGWATPIRLGATPGELMPLQSPSKRAA